MHDITEESLLLAVQVRKTLFEMFEEMFSSDNYLKVLIAFEEEMNYAEISEAADVSEGTVANAFGELEEYGLIGNGENGRYHTLPVLTHPMIQYYYWKEVVGDE